jgi:beta-N-acetylhexosaminidase
MKIPTPETLADQVGQMIWFGFEGTEFTGPLVELVQQVRPGGLILFGRNIQTPEQVRRLNDDLHRAVPIPPFIALDQEGGRVSRLRPFLGPTPSGLSLAARRDARDAVGRYATATARAVRALGFNVNFAPVLDLSGADQSNGIGDRAFGSDPGVVIALGRAYLQACLRAGVIPVGKHFPGLGSARGDTHAMLPVIRTDRKRLWATDLLPYRRLRSLLPMVMVGHARYPALQGEEAGPASLSAAVITGLLRQRIGYRGLVLTDDLEMGAVDQGLDGAAQAIAAFAAGGDGLMFCRSADRIREAHAGLVQALTDRRLPRARLGSAVNRILMLKRRHPGGERRPAFSAATLERTRVLMARLAPAPLEGPDPTARA